MTPFGILVPIIFLVAYLFYPIFRAEKINASSSLVRVYEQHPINPVQRILVAGDSTGVGIGADKESSTAGRLGADNPTSDIKNISVSGYRLKDLIKSLQAESEHHYDLIVLQIGANDIVHMTSYKDIGARLDTTLSLAEQIGTKVVVLTSGNVGSAPIFRFPLSTFYTARTRVARNIFIDTISNHKNTTYIDLYKDGLRDPFESDVKRYYSHDGFHPSGAGYGLWYQEIKGAL